jgi:hypothetical protein
MSSFISVLRVINIAKNFLLSPTKNEFEIVVHSLLTVFIQMRLRYRKMNFIGEKKHFKKGKNIKLFTSHKPSQSSDPSRRHW